MRHRLPVMLATCCLLLRFAWVPSASLASAAGVAAIVHGTGRKPASYKSPLGCEIEVPAGLEAIPADSKVLLAPRGGGYEVFVVRTCPGPVPQSCLSYPEWPAHLVEIAHLVMDGRPATQYVFERRNKPEQWTRQWTEVHTTVTDQGKTYDVAALIAPYYPAEEWDRYRWLRQSFHITTAPWLPRTYQWGAAPLVPGAGITTVCPAPLSDRQQQAVFMSTIEFAGSRRSRVALGAKGVVQFAEEAFAGEAAGRGAGWPPR